MAQRVAVIGAGVGGLSAAARLAHRGCSVEVFEKRARCGGRANIVEDQGFKFDTGPSFVLMPFFFEEAFTSCGASLREYLDLRALEEHYRIFYPDGKRLSVFADPRRTMAELERFEPGAAAAYEGFLGETGRFYRLVEPLLYQCFGPRDALRPSLWPLIRGLRPWESYWSVARRYFKSEALAYAFTFEAMFMGVSPFEAPGFYSIITYADHAHKIWHPMGGMYRIPQALERLGQKFGVRYHYSQEARAVRRRRNTVVVRTDRGEEGFDRVVINADYAYARQSLLGRRLPRYRYSCSVYLMYLGLSGRAEGLAHHNLFFARDLRRNLQDIFARGRVPADPSFYVHVPTRTDPSLAPQGRDIAYVLVPVANLDHPAQPFEEREQALRETVFSTVKRATGIDLEAMTTCAHTFYPRDFIARYNICHAATFGLAHTLLQSAFFRPATHDAAVPGVHYVGASTQPGGGLPVVLAGARIVADEISGRASRSRQ